MTIKTHFIDNQLNESLDKKTSNIGERNETIVPQNNGSNEDSKCSE
jgi:hypothetical protein